MGHLNYPRVVQPAPRLPVIQSDSKFLLTGEASYEKMFSRYYPSSLTSSNQNVTGLWIDSGIAVWHGAFYYRSPPAPTSRSSIAIVLPSASCTVRSKGYEAYQDGAAAEDDPQGANRAVR